MSHLQVRMMIRIIHRTDVFPFSGSTLADCDARANFRKLWSDHVYLTHDFIAAAFNGSEDLSQVTSRLLQNQADIGNAFRAKYGDAAADRITQLFRDHILIAADVVADVKSGDQAKLFQDQQRWKQNAQQIAAYLCSLNLNTRPDCVQVNICSFSTHLTKHSGLHGHAVSSP